MSLLSDITTPNGKTIITQFIRGKKPKYPHATFKWPNQDFPSKSAWTRWFKRIKQIFTVEKNGEIPVSKQLRGITPIKERQMIHRWYYSEINEEFYKINEE